VLQLYRRFGLGTPPAAEVLEELRKRHNDRKKHLHADHIIAIEARPELRRELCNMQTLCDSCHAAKTLQEQGRAANMLMGGPVLYLGRRGPEPRRALV
jgi:5-methylcytosine-specific restriction endonuclease McrA